MYIKVILIRSVFTMKTTIYSKNTDESLDERRRVLTNVEECRRVTKRV